MLRRSFLPILLVCFVAALVSVSPVAPANREARADVPGQGEQVPLYDQWTSTTQVYRNIDGTFTTVMGAGPIQARDPASATGWSPIDTTLQPTANGLSPDQADAAITFSSGEDAAPLATVAQDGTSLSVGLDGDVPAPSVSGDTATYPDVQPGVDATLQATPSGFEESFLVDSVDHAPESLAVPLDLDRLTPSLTPGDALVLTDATGHVVGGADPAMMWGAATDPATGEPTVVALVPTSLVATADGFILELTPDPAFFTDPTLTWPVTIDPAVNLTIQVDAYVDSSQPTTSFGSSLTIRSGKANSGALYRGFIGFGTGPINGTYVVSASLSLWETWAASCTPTQVDVYSVSSSVTPPFTWNNKPAEGALYSSGSSAQGCNGNPGNLTLAQAGPGGPPSPTWFRPGPTEPLSPPRWNSAPMTKPTSQRARNSVPPRAPHLRSCR